MRSFFSKKVIIIIIFIIIIVSLSIFFLWYKTSPKLPIDSTISDRLTPDYLVIGQSVEGRKIESYTYGQGKNQIVFVGGIHGGYEWNSVLLAYNFIDYLQSNHKFIPNNLKVTVIPTANPDGLFKVTGKDGRFSITDIATTTTVGLGRFNAHNVDLNRNFDCKWQPNATWRGNTVSAGSKAFSEPEAAAIRDYALANKPQAFVFWHSQSNAVYASECQAGILPETLKIMEAYSLGSGYPAIKSFNSYPVTGDAEGWLASVNIPAITVELKTHETIEWEKNLSGIKALLDYYKLD